MTRAQAKERSPEAAAILNANCRNFVHRLRARGLCVRCKRPVSPTIARVIPFWCCLECRRKQAEYDHRRRMK